MRYFLSILFIIFIYNQVTAQRKFKSSQWEEWDQAAQQLEIGNFDMALSIYRLELDNPGFSYRFKQTQNLKNIYSEGLKLQKEGKFSEAIAMFKRHRSIDGVGSLGAFERKIEECIRLLGPPDNSKLKDLQRRNLAAEYSYKAYKKLLAMDIQGALKDYRLAKTFGNTSFLLGKKYEDDLHMIQEVVQWQQLVQQSIGKGLELEKVAYGKYRDIKGVPVLPSIETKIQIVIAQIEGKNVLLSLAQNCETDALLGYVQEHKSEFTQSATFVSKLRQYISIRNKIDTLSRRLDNAETVKSAFVSAEDMVHYFEDLPDEINRSLTRCLKNDKYRVNLGFSIMAVKNNDYEKAKHFLEVAKGIGLPEKENEITELEKAITSNTNCIGIDEFKTDMMLARNELKRCNLLASKKAWQAGELQLLDCDEKNKILQSYNSLLDSINRIGADMRSFNAFVANVKKSIQNGKYNEANNYIDRIKLLVVCDTLSRNLEIEPLINKIKNFRNRHKFALGASGSIGANKPMYKINDNEYDISYGITTTAGLQFSFRDPGSPSSILMSIEYFSTNYNSLNADDLALENFKVVGASGSINIKFHILQTGKIKPNIKIGAEGIIPVMYRYRNYSATIETSDKSQLNNFLLSGQGGIGLDIGKFSIDAYANYGLASIYDRSATNLSSTPNQEVNARFRRAGIRIGFWIF
ncbi:PorT family protein [Dyadobacter chenhuakuii]|uniref:PorT family protein n=1 Tax=Dyadobacter chenhuakuii TaxID=2909339 RepID=A0ABY4XMC1_9BACT|nr:PorT family protein [Dyadobacter chenhuakuii]MCF2494266.1 PorT family protein [Dyadobacter chenhuakuii]USJ31391.1 PorT family protein [Dyadobacter chenhuakuii]